MLRTLTKRWLRKRSTSRPRPAPSFFRPFPEVLEDRTMLASALAPSAAASLLDQATPLHRRETAAATEDDRRLEPAADAEVGPHPDRGAADAQLVARS